MARPQPTSAARRVPAAGLALAAAGLALVLAGCAAPQRAATRAELEARVAAQPDDADALRALGLRLALDGAYVPARDVLTRAVALRPADGQALFALGLASEVVGPPAAAEDVYARYVTVPREDVYRDSLQGRLDQIVRRRLRTEFAGALAADTMPAGAGGAAVGVLPFAYRGADPQFAALGRGLAEVLSADLAAVGGLTVVERVRLDALLAEYALAERGQLDARTAPRAGGLLRAERLVGGEVDVRGEALRLDAAVWSAVPDSLAGETAEGGLAEFFALQRALTRGVLAALGVEVSAALAEPPTDDLAAFLLFSRGLLEDDDGQFRRAAELYGQALARDPGFGLAAARRAAATRAAASARPAAAALLLAAAPASDDGLDLVGLRADALSAQLRALVAPGPDTREPVVEGSRAGILGSLPDPPPPPAGGSPR